MFECFEIKSGVLETHLNACSDFGGTLPLWWTMIEPLIGNWTWKPWLIHDSCISGYTPSVGEYHMNSMHCILRIGSGTLPGHKWSHGHHPILSSESQSRVWVMVILDQSTSSTHPDYGEIFMHPPHSLPLLCTPYDSYEWSIYKARPWIQSLGSILYYLWESG